MIHECIVSLADQTLWLLTTLVEAFVVCLFLTHRLFRKFFFFNLYLLLLVMISIGRYAVLTYSGLGSSTYFYFWYQTDALLTVTLFICIGELSVRLVGTRLPARRAALWCAAVLLVTALYSFAVTSGMASRVATRFVFELSQNLYFACCLAAFLLWVWKLRNQPEDQIAARFVNVLGVYCLLFSLTYGARQLGPETARLTANMYPMIAAWLPIGSGFALCSPKQP